MTTGSPSDTRRRQQARLQAENEGRQALVSEHIIVGHGRRRAMPGCPYCYPPGRWGDYMPGPTYREILEGK